MGGSFRTCDGLPDLGKRHLHRDRRIPRKDSVSVPARIPPSDSIPDSTTYPSSPHRRFRHAMMSGRSSSSVRKTKENFALWRSSLPPRYVWRFLHTSLSQAVSIFVTTSRRILLQDEVLDAPLTSVLCRGLRHIPPDNEVLRPQTYRIVQRSPLLDDSIHLPRVEGPCIRPITGVLRPYCT